MWLENLVRRHIRYRLRNGAWRKHRGKASWKNVLEYSMSGRVVKTYVSLAEYLFPGRVSCLACLWRAYPLRTDFGIDVDGYMSGKTIFGENFRGFWLREVDYARSLTLEVIDLVRDNYEKWRIRTVFSGRRGFQVWILGWRWEDWAPRTSWTSIREKVLLMREAKKRYSRYISTLLGWIDRWHIAVMADLTRIFALPGTIDWRTRLAVIEVDLERMGAERVVEKSMREYARLCAKHRAYFMREEKRKNISVSI